MSKKLKAIATSLMVGIFFVLANLASYTTFTWLKEKYDFSWPTVLEQATIAAGGITIMVLIGFILSRFFFPTRTRLFQNIRRCPRRNWAW
ncbi:hypothetical protein [Listeria rocourtiae]|uniref:hypothetical protein n=1 Tax=Listeria rocourtiae TaxID=647910 RepID=UPI0003E89A9A|nr:hypothetical protein [Listeria rocourtiae]EUJ47555.1 hypothetical protein PROCOU_08222 [Listeria rocourtiae FSL F6-920]